MFDFLKNLILDNLDNVPEDARSAYAKGADGKYTLLPVVKSLVEAHAGVNTSLGTVRGDLTKAQKEANERRIALKAFEDMAAAFNVEIKDGDVAGAFKTMVDDLTGKAKNGAEVTVNMGKMKADYDRRVAEMKAESDGQVGKMKGTLEKYLIENAAVTALSAEKGNSTLLLPHIKSRVKVVADGDNFVVRVVDAAGDARSDGKGGWLGVADLVKEMRGDKTYAMAFESDTKGGGGANPAGKTTSTSTVNPNAGQGTPKVSSISKIQAGLDKGQYQGGKA